MTRIILSILIILIPEIFTSCTGDATNQSENKTRPVEQIQPKTTDNPYDGEYHDGEEPEIDCEETLRLMVENEGKPEAIGYMTQNCIGSTEYSESLSEVLGVTMRKCAPECIDYIENELIKTLGNTEQADFIIERMKTMIIDGEDELNELAVSINKARDCETKRRIVNEILQGSSTSPTDKSLKYNSINVPMFVFDDNGKEIFTGKLIDVKVVELHQTELLQAVIDVQDFGRSEIVISNDLKTYPELTPEIDGLAYFNAHKGKTVWFQSQTIKAPDGSPIKVISDLVIFQKSQFADFVCDDAAQVYIFLQALVKSARAENPQFIAEFITPFEFKAEGKTYSVDDTEDALNAVPVVFNNKVKNAIVNQSIAKLTANQYGIMLGNGEIWINYNSDKKKMEIFRINPL